MTAEKIARTVMPPGTQVPTSAQQSLVDTARLIDCTFVCLNCGITQHFETAEARADGWTLHQKWCIAR